MPAVTSAAQQGWVKGDATLEDDNKVGSLHLSARLTVLNVVEVDSVRQCFVADVFCHVSASSERPESDVKARPEWQNVEVEWQDTNSLDPKGWVREERGDQVSWFFRGRKTFSEALELEHFPFDYQKLSFILSNSLPTVRVEGDKGPCVALQPLVSSDNPGQEPCIVHADRLVISNEWEYLGYTIKTELSSPEMSRWRRQFTNLTFSLCFKRRAGFYLWNIAVPTFVLTSLGWVVFAMDAADWVGDRTSITVTLLLTSAAYKIVIAQSLPAVPYLTILDKYVLASFAFLVLITIASAVAHMAEDPRVDDVAAVVLAGLWALTHVVLGAMALMGSRAARQGLGHPLHRPAQTQRRCRQQQEQGSSKGSVVPDAGKGKADAPGTPGPRYW